MEQWKEGCELTGVKEEERKRGREEERKRGREEEREDGKVKKRSAVESRQSNTNELIEAPFVCVQRQSGRAVRQTDRQTDRQTERVDKK
jgi:hypothetical protein